MAQAKILLGRTPVACSIIRSKRVTSKYHQSWWLSPAKDTSICVTTRHMSAKYAKKRAVMKAKRPQPASATTSLAAELLGDFTEEQKQLEEAANKKDSFEEQLKDVARLVFEAKAQKKFIKFGQVFNRLEVPHKYSEAVMDKDLSSYEEHLRELQGLSKPTSPHSVDRMGEVVELVGTPNPSIPMSDTPCSGCGSVLHCQDTGVPGYMPSEKFLMLTAERLRKALCQRCFMLRRHNIAMNVSVTPEQYVDVIRQIADKQGLVLIVVDLTDLPNSIYSALPSIIGEKRPVYIVGNKVDVLPKDSQGYLGNTMQCLQYYIHKLGFADAFHVHHMTLVSAKTGYGIEDLITKLLDDWSKKGPVYVVGCTNVGKSTLFNALLSSDYCRSASRDFISRATTSTWPGTTLNVLKFPIINPKPAKMMKRIKRLERDKIWQVEEEKVRKSKLVAKGDYRYATLIGHIGQTFLSPKKTLLDCEEHIGTDTPSYVLNAETEEMGTVMDLKKEQLKEKIKRIQVLFDEEAKRNSHWCHDTPGVINPNQIINLLTQEELAVMLSERLIMPRTFKMRPGQSMFICGLGRIDYAKGRRYILVTVFCNFKLPVVIVQADQTHTFYYNNIGTRRLIVPIGDFDRLNKLPSLVGKEFSMTGYSTEESAADITLSSLGWVAVTPQKDDEVTVRAYTPGGVGMHKRSPALLPFAVMLRGRQITNGAYEVKRPLQ